MTTRSLAGWCATLLLASACSSDDAPGAAGGSAGMNQSSPSNAGQGNASGGRGNSGGASGAGKAGMTARAGGAGSAGADPGEPLPMQPLPGECDPAFRGPFCENDRIIGFSLELPKEPTLAQVRQYSLEAVNYLRARTCLPPLVPDDCLDDIAARALAVGGFHVYFIANCMNAEHGFGRNCECNWAQENIGAASGTRRTATDGVQVPLCHMMEEDFGTGHRSNIEHLLWKRLGIGVEYNANGASWHHEFGCDAALEACPK